MDRILIVEDKKALANLIAKKLKTELDVETDIAYSLSEAKLFLKRYKYFVTLLDLNLPDAPDGEVVDYVIKNEQKAIVLSGNIDKNFRANMLKKNIIDYVNKGGLDDIEYVISIIKRLKKNQNHKILVVDDSIVFRKQMQTMLENMFYKVTTVAHGEEANNLLQLKNDYSLVLTDYNMPVMNGLELTTEIRREYNKNQLAIIAISGNSDDEVTALFLKNGANDYITKPFSKEEFSCRVNNTIEALENIQYITNSANRDFLTGLYNRRFFFNDVDKYFTKALEENEEFAIGMIDIDHFKKINDTYGHDTGDKAIVNLSEILRSNVAQEDVVARFGGEEFCLVLKNLSQTKAVEIFENLRSKVENSLTISEKGEEIRYTISIGVALNYENTLEDTVNQSDILLYEAKQSGRNRVVAR